MLLHNHIEWNACLPSSNKRVRVRDVDGGAVYE